MWCFLNNSTGKVDSLNITLNEETVQRKDWIRYLGVTFYRNLSFRYSVEHIIQKCECGLAALKTIIVMIVGNVIQWIDSVYDMKDLCACVCARTRALVQIKDWVCLHWWTHNANSERAYRLKGWEQIWGARGIHQLQWWDACSDCHP